MSVCCWDVLDFILNVECTTYSHTWTQHTHEHSLNRSHIRMRARTHTHTWNSNANAQVRDTGHFARRGLHKRCYSEPTNKYHGMCVCVCVCVCVPTNKYHGMCVCVCVLLLLLPYVCTHVLLLRMYVYKDVALNRPTSTMACCCTFYPASRLWSVCVCTYVCNCVYMCVVHVTMYVCVCVCERCYM
jgi:hypothetical protein